MAELKNRIEIERVARIVAEPVVETGAAKAPHEVDRTFGLPVGLHVATVALYLAFLGVMGTAFAAPGLAIPMAIFVLFIVAAFGVPALWTRMAPENASRAMSWGEMQRGGIDTLTGRMNAGDAAAQVLVLPVLIVFWGLAVALIAALV